MMPSASCNDNRAVHRSTHGFNHLAREALAGIAQDLVCGIQHTVADPRAVLQDDEQRNKGQHEQEHSMQDLAAQCAGPCGLGLLVQIAAEQFAGAPRIAQVGSPPACAVLPEGHLRQPFRHGKSVLTNVRERLDQVLPLLRGLMDGKPDRQEQHQADDQRKGQGRQNVRRLGANARRKFPVCRPDRSMRSRPPSSRAPGNPATSRTQEQRDPPPKRCERQVVLE